jgi:ATP-dependent Lhr-like helicase
VAAPAAPTPAPPRRIEPRRPVVDAPDVLVQHLVTCALGGGFRPAELRDEVRTTNAFARMSEDEWQWALDFVVHGGASLNAYPEYRRVAIDDDGIARVHDRGIAHRHRMSIGTIVSDASITVQFRNGAKLGHVEESFVASLKPGDCFAFAGRVVEFIRVRELTAWVKPANVRAA